MKKTLLAISLALLGIFTFAQERIAVFPFEDLDNLLSRTEYVLFYREFSNEFTNKSANRFTVVPRQEVEKLINTEARFQLTDFSSREKTAEMERVLNGTQILSGIIGKVGNRITISVSLYTYPDLIQLPGGASQRVSNVVELFDKIPELVQSMQNEIGKGGTGGTGGQPPANMVRVEGGTFQMGNPSGGQDNERPVHTVTVKSFYMGKYEVTQREWREIMGTTLRQQRDMRDKSLSLYGEGDNYPMYYVSWYEAVEYCNKLSIREGLTPAYSGSDNNITCDWKANGYRLPTEAEWEFAAKGGNKDSLVYEYSGSNNVGTVAWYLDNSGGSTHPVGTKAANSLGIYDMSGNEWEWCWDRYGIYSSSSQTDPRGTPSSINERVIRGGSWYNSAYRVRSAHRNSWLPFDQGYIYGVGFRLVRNAN
jgi:formylglycine-generating enzyme required for sulfatase activity/TolB-like protein